MEVGQHPWGIFPMDARSSSEEPRNRPAMKTFFGEEKLSLIRPVNYRLHIEG